MKKIRVFKNNEKMFGKSLFEYNLTKKSDAVSKKPYE